MTYISPERRKEAATVHSGGRAKFPVDSVHTAKSALKLLGTAKPPLSSSQKAIVKREAAKYGVKSRPKGAK